MLCRHLFWLSIGTVAERRETPWEEWLIPWSEGPDSAPCCPGGGLAPFIPLALFPGMVSVVVVVGGRKLHPHAGPGVRAGAHLHTLPPRPHLPGPEHMPLTWLWFPGPKGAD